MLLRILEILQWLKNFSNVVRRLVLRIVRGRLLCIYLLREGNSIINFLNTCHICQTCHISILTDPFNRHDKLTKFFIERGADPFIVDNVGKNPVQLVENVPAYHAELHGIYHPLLSSYSITSNLLFDRTHLES